MKRKKVLVIDDEEDFTFLMKGFFASKGYQVFLAGSIRDGLAILNKECPDVVFLDNNLPDGLGWQISDFICSNYPDIQLNLISAYHVPKTSVLSFRIIEKPILLEELSALVET
jgi:DNA-binding NtrC family response regulator